MSTLLYYSTVQIIMGMCNYTYVFSIACIHEDREYRLGEIIEIGCSEKLICRPGNPRPVFQTEQQICTYAIRGTVNGDPHYLTYDGRWHHFQGKCEYVLTKLCDSDEFIISAKNDGHGGSAVSCVSRVTVSIQGLKIVLGRGQPGTIEINGTLHSNNQDGVILTQNGVKVERIGGKPVVFLTRHGVRLSWNGLYKVEIDVAKRLFGRLCGLLGNYNNNSNDDITLRDGTEVTVDEFGNSWLIPNTNIPGCTGNKKRDTPQLPTCSNDPTVILQARKRCNVTRQHPFTSCNSIVDPASFIENCEFDYRCCSEEEREDCYCDNLATYAAACAEAGRPPSNWRSFYCRKKIIYIYIILLYYYIILYIKTHGSELRDQGK